MQFLKKCLSVLFVLFMLLSVLPMGVFADSGSDGGFYAILHLDAGRKYIKPEIIKRYIDDMAAAGYNQLELYLSDNQGFRFLLDNTTITTKSGVRFDLVEDDIVNGGIVTDDPSVEGWFRPSQEEAQGRKYYLTQSEMTDIIQYARKKGIELVPAINMPGHMGAILRSRPEDWRAYDGTTKTSLNLDNQEAVEYTLAILQAYADYFAAMGCKYFSIGADEYGYDIGVKTGNIVSENGTLYQNIAGFMNQCADIIIGDGMTPRAFSDFFTTAGFLNQKFEVYVWQTEKVNLQGTYKVINTSDACYFALGSDWYSEADTNANTQTFHPMTVTVKGVGSANFSSEPDGAMMCIWCDRGYYEDEAGGSDGGEKLYTQSIDAVNYFAGSMEALGYVTSTQYLDIGETFTVTGIPGTLNAEEIAVNECLTVSVTHNTSYPDASTELTKATALEAGDYLIGNGTNFLTVNADGSLGSTSDPSAAVQWSIAQSDSGYRISYNGQNLHWNGTYGETDLALSTEADVWFYDSSKGFWQQGPSYEVLLWYSDTWKTWYAVNAEVQGHPYTAEVTQGEPVYTSDVTFTAGAEGTAEVSLNGSTYYFVVGDVPAEAEHHYEWRYDDTGHWQVCTDEGCTSATEKTSHFGGTATCQKKAACAACGAEYGELADHNYSAANCQAPATCTICGVTTGEADTTNHIHTELRSAKAATLAEGGYSGDLYCTDCSTLITQGRTLAVIDPNVVKVAVPLDGSKTVTLTGQTLEPASGSDGYISYTVEQSTSYPDAQAVTTKTTELATGEYLIGNGTYFLTVNTDGSLGNTSDASAAVQWSITQSGSGYTISYNGQSLHWNGTYGGTDLALSTQADIWFYDSSKGFWQQGPSYEAVLWCSDTWKTWYAVNADVQGHPYTVSIDLGDPVDATAITFFGNALGESDVTIGDTQYHVSVVPADVADQTLTVVYRITNFAVTGKTSHQTSRVIQAADVYSEEGAALGALVDETGTWAWGAADGYVVYWKGVYLTGKTQSGDGTGTDQSLRGADFQQLRYWDGQWAYLDGDSQWQTITVAEGNQVVAYYMNHTDVTQEIETRVVDWGYTKPSGSFDGTNNDMRNGFAILDYDVRYPSGVRNPDSFPNNNTFSFHTLDGDAGNKQVISNGSNSIRRVGMSLGVNSSDYEVYMITVTRSADDVDTKLAAIPSSIPVSTNIGDAAETDLYQGTEYVAWSLEEMTEADFENLGMPKVPGLNGAAGENEENQSADENPGLWNAWYHAVTSDYHFGGDPYVASVYIVENQGLRITFWVRQKQTEAPVLNVNYHDITGGGDTIFHAYSILLPDGSIGTFPDNIFYDALTKTLENAAVTNSLGVVETVEANLTKMKGLIPASYVTGMYDWVQFTLSEDGKTLDLYYQRGDAKCFVVDFGLPIDVTLGDLDLANVDTFSSFACNVDSVHYGEVSYERMGEGYDSSDKAVVFTYTPTAVIKGTEHIVLTFGYTDGTRQAMDVCIIPATTVYYEEGFAAFSGSWSAGAKNGIGSQQTAQPGQRGAYNYGYDSIYADRKTASNGTAAVTSGIGDKASFSFVGTGVDVSVNTKTDSGFAMFILRDSNGSIVKAAIVDTHMQSGEEALSANQDVIGFNEPIVSVTGLTWGSYTAELRHVKLNDNANPISFDGFRIYNTMNHHADSFYAKDGEADPAFIELRDCALFTANVSTSADDTIYADQIANEIHRQVYDSYTDNTGKPTVILIQGGTNVNSSTAVTVKQDLLDNGPKNEVYLYGSNTLTIAIPKGYDAQIGLKNLSGSPITAKINDSEVRALSSTEMYFKLTGKDDNNYTISVSSTDETSILAITKLKLIPNGKSSSAAVLSLLSIQRALLSMGYEEAPVPVTVNAELTEDHRSIAVRLTNGAEALTGVRFAVWARNSFASTLKWVNAEKTADGVWAAEVPACGFHTTAGDTFVVHAYGTTSASDELLGDTTVEVTVIAPHVYTDDKDDTCNDCGFVRQLEPEKIETVPMYRLYNPNSGEHFFTGSQEERDNLVDVGWNYEGVAWNAPVYIGSPVYRVFNPNSGDHHYTMSMDEVYTLVELGWKYEGVAWNSAPADNPRSVVQYRLYNPNADLGCHHYTSSVTERDSLVNEGWNFEGTGWFGLR